MHKPIIIIALLMLASAAFADGFRGAKWGDSMEAVLAQEGKPVSQSKTDLYYKVKVAGLDTLVAFQFDEKGLYSGFYSFTGHYTNKNQHLSDYDKLKDLLTEKYGKPIDDDVVWRQDLYKDNPSRWGTAVSAGHLVFNADWQTDATRIRMRLSGEGYEVHHGILYQDLSSVERVTARRRQQQKDGL